MLRPDVNPYYIRTVQYDDKKEICLLVLLISRKNRRKLWACLERLGLGGPETNELSKGSLLKSEM